MPEVYALNVCEFAPGLLLSWETGDALCGCTDRCASSIRATTRAIPRAFAVKIDEATAAVDRQLSVTRNFVSRLGTGVYPEISVLRSSGPEFWRRWRSKEDKTLSRTAVVLSGLLLFGALGGRRLSLTPSNVRSIGAFARQEVRCLGVPDHMPHLLNSFQCTPLPGLFPCYDGVCLGRAAQISR